MVNIDDFIKRLELILDYYNLSASAFADKISVQRSSLSHLLSGRNKPSLDFIIKVVEVFPEVDLYWILNGKGTFPKSEAIIISNDKHQKNDTEKLFDEKKESTNDLFSTAENNSLEKEIETFENKSNPAHSVFNKPIEQIVIFYKDGTFKNYTP